jgi:hypothetical protein
LIKVIAQIVGLFALACIVLSFQLNERKKLIFVQMIGMLLFAVHFALLGAYTGLVMNILCAVRAAVYYDRSKKWVRSPLCPALFAALSLGISIVTWSSPWSILPGVGTALTSVSTWLSTPKLIRRVGLPASPAWLVYDIVSGSYTGVLNECFVMASIIVAMIRYDLPKKEGKKA